MFSPLVVILRSPETATVETTPSSGRLAAEEIEHLAEHAGERHLIAFFLLHLGLGGCSGGERDRQDQRGNRELTCHRCHLLRLHRNVERRYFRPGRWPAPRRYWSIGTRSPRSVARTGSARWPLSSSASAISPSASRSANAGARQQARPFQRVPERLRELRVGHRRRARGIQRTARAFSGDHPRHQANPVVLVNPRHVLRARAERASDKHLKRREHLRQRAALTVEHDARANQRHARDVCDLIGRGLPVFREAGQKVRARRGRFGEGFVAAIAVVADGRSADEHPRADAAPAEWRSVRLRVASSRLSRSFCFLRSGPALGGNRFAGKVDDGVAPSTALRPGSGAAVGRPWHERHAWLCGALCPIPGA